METQHEVPDLRALDEQMEAEMGEEITCRWCEDHFRIQEDQNYAHVVSVRRVLEDGEWFDQEVHHLLPVYE